MPDNYSHTRIKKLSPLLINQLAAGEVVTRPASVVKELLENAIDAGATLIEVRITQGGMGMIEVVDNGSGIHPDDMVMAITRHATSKVADVAHLHGISTLGFRGEALAATAAVSRLTLTSSHDVSGIGRQLQVAGVLADIPKLVPVVHGRGTTITVKDLYFNVPARRGNLKSIATEFSHIEAIVREVALARADVTLNLLHDNKKRLMLSANSNVTQSNAHNASTTTAANSRYLPLSRLEQALGLELSENALEIMVDLSSLIQPTAETTEQSGTPQVAQISGWLWPTFDTSQHRPKLLYVNGRLIKDATISNQLRQLAATASIINMGYALHFELPSQWLNINVHPSKQRIKISPLNNIMAHLNHSIRHKLKAADIKKASDENDSVTPDLSQSASYFMAQDSAVESANVPRNIPHNVQSLKQPYQSFNTATATEYSIESSSMLYANTEHNISDVNFNKESKFLESAYYSHIQDGTSLKVKNETRVDNLNTRVTLPQCLEVFNDLSLQDFANFGLSRQQPTNIDTVSEGLVSEGLVSEGLISDDGIGDYPVKDNSMPLIYLLFYYQGRLALISKNNWLEILHALLDTGYPEIQVLVTHKAMTNISMINQQLSRYAMQLSAQDLHAFATDFAARLVTESIQTLESRQLITIMLSSSVNQR